MNTPLTLLLPTGSRLGGPGTPQRNAGRGDQGPRGGHRVLRVASAAGGARGGERVELGPPTFPRFDDDA